MPQKKATHSPTAEVNFTMPHANYSAMVRVMDELSFRGRMQEALVMRIANAGGISEVITTIKRRRLYTKKMGDSAPAVDHGQAAPAPARRAKKKATRKARPTQAQPAGDQHGGDTEGE